MAKVTLRPMAGQDHPIYQRGIHIGAPVKASRGEAKLPSPAVIYDTDRDRGDLELICTVEWSWSSYHERIDSYYFGVTDTEYELWSHYNDESTGNKNWCCCVVANKTAIGIVEAPAWLLEHLWRHESTESSIGLFDMVSEDGLLDQDEVIQIGKAIWSE